MSTKVTNYLQLRYYQYEVTFGLYMMNYNEKLLLNAIILAIFAAVLYALCLGVEPLVLRLLCCSVH